MYDFINTIEDFYTSLYDMSLPEAQFVAGMVLFNVMKLKYAGAIGIVARTESTLCDLNFQLRG